MKSGRHFQMVQHIVITRMRLFSPQTGQNRAWESTLSRLSVPPLVPLDVA